MKTLCFCFICAALSLGLLHTQSAESPRLASTPTQLCLTGSGNSFNPVFSADGRYLVFVSQAHNLVTNDSASPHLGIFVRDLVNSNTVLVSVNTNGTGGGNDNCNFPAISSNGQIVAFASPAGNLVPNDTNTFNDVFVRDIISGVTRLASGDPSGNPPATFDWMFPPNASFSNHPLLSGDGHLVFFESWATNLVAQLDTNNSQDIFVRDMTADTTSLVSVNTAGGVGNGSSDLGSITPDGRFVAFSSKAKDLVNGFDTNRFQEIYVRDLQSQITYWASSNALPPFAPPATFYEPVLSQDGHFVYFKKSGVVSNFVDELWRFDLQAQDVVPIATNVLPQNTPWVNADGRYAAYSAPDGIYMWDGLVQSNRFRACGDSPSLSTDASILLYKMAQISCNGSNAIPGIYVQEIASGATHLISQKMDGSPATFIEVAEPALSSDGRLVAFESLDDGIVTNDLNQASDIFVRDWVANTTILVSQAHSARPTQTGPGMSTLGPNCVSADGRFVVFSAFDTSLVARDTNQWLDAFAKDLQTGDVIPLSVSQTNPPFQAMLAAHDPVISRDGRFAAWVWRDPINYKEFFYLYDPLNRTNLGAQSSTTNLLPRELVCPKAVLNRNGSLLAYLTGSTDFAHAVSSLYLLDLLARTNQMVAYDALDPQFSPDGQWLLFRSKASNLTTNPVNGTSYQLFARNLLTQQTRLVSIGSDGSGLPYDVINPGFSANSQYVVFGLWNYGTLSRSIFRHDLLGQATNIVVCPEAYLTSYANPSISADGRWVAYASRPSGDPFNIYVKDLQTSETTLISGNRFGTGIDDNYSTSPVISGDGRFVVFLSTGSNLVDIPINGQWNLYVRDRLLGTTMLATINRQGTAGGNGKSSQPILAADGRTVIFQSFANDLVEGDYNETQDIFVLRLGGVDSDGDGMDDDWEIAYFGDLSHDGTADPDRDGRSDLQEFLAGTDPTNGGSVLRVMTLSQAGGANTTILWSAVLGRSYQVQFKTNITDNAWTDLPGTVTATATTGAKLDPSAGATTNRFYRVLWQP